MADDREVLKEIWNGKVPVCFQLSLDEVVSSTPPENLYVSALWLRVKYSYRRTLTKSVIRVVVYANCQWVVNQCNNQKQSLVVP